MGVFVWFHRGIARIDARKAMVHRYSNALNFRNADAAPGSPVTGIESVSKRAYGHGVVGERSGLYGVASHGGNRTCTHICQLVRTFGNSVWGYFRRSHVWPMRRVRYAPRETCSQSKHRSDRGSDLSTSCSTVMSTVYVLISMIMTLIREPAFRGGSTVYYSTVRLHAQPSRYLCTVLLAVQVVIVRLIARRDHINAGSRPVWLLPAPTYSS